MPRDETTARVTRRNIDRHGEPVELTNYEQDGADDYGETWVETTRSPQTVQALRGTRQQPTPDSDAYQAGSVAVDQEFIVSDAVDGIRDGGGEGASTLEDGDGITYTVLDRVTRPGFKVLYCRREA